MLAIVCALTPELGGCISACSGATYLRTLLHRCSLTTTIVLFLLRSHIVLARCLVPLYVFGKLLSCTTPLYPLLQYSCEKSTCACSMLSTNSHSGSYSTLEYGMHYPKIKDCATSTHGVVVTRWVVDTWIPGFISQCV